LNDNALGYLALNKMIAERSLFRGVEKIGDLVLNRINECIIGISNDECYHIYFNTSQHSTPLEALKFENNLSIDKKNVYLFQDERYKAIDVEDISFALPPLSILLITNESH
jgi:hypothetical protein